MNNGTTPVQAACPDDPAARAGAAPAATGWTCCGIHCGLLAVTGLVVALVVGAWTWHVAQLGQDIVAVLNITVGFASSPAPRPPSPPPPLVAGLTPSGATWLPGGAAAQTLTEVMPPMAWPPEGHGIDASAARFVSSMLPDLASWTATLDARVASGLASLPMATPPEAFPDPDRAEPDDNTLQATSRLLAAVARARADAGDRRGALHTALGLALLAQAVEAGAPAGLTRRERSAASLLRRQAAAVVLDLVADAAPGRTDARDVAAQLLHLEAAIAPARWVLDAEMRELPSLARFLTRTIADGTAQQRFGRVPHRLAAALAPPGPERILAPLDAPFVNAATMTYAEIRAGVPVYLQTLQDLQRRSSAFGPQTFDHLLHPSHFAVTAMALFTFPDFPDRLSEDVLDRTRLRGAAVAMLVTAWQRERGAWPPDPAAVAAFAGLPELPADLCSGAPLRYTPGPTARLWSVGEDAADATTDDLVFLPARPAPRPSRP